MTVPCLLHSHDSFDLLVLAGLVFTYFLALIFALFSSCFAHVIVVIIRL